MIKPARKCIVKHQCCCGCHIFLIPCILCRSLKIWMKSQLGTFSQWRHLLGICWGISTFRSATEETRRYKLINSPQCFVAFWNLSYSTTCFAMGRTSHISCCLVFLSDRKWRSYWSGQRGRSQLLFLTLFQHVKICQESSYLATSLVENHGEQKSFCLLICFIDAMGRNHWMNNLGWFQWQLI